MRFEQVQRFILAKEISWGWVHFKTDLTPKRRLKLTEMSQSVIVPAHNYTRSDNLISFERFGERNQDLTMSRRFIFYFTKFCPVGW